MRTNRIVAAVIGAFAVAGTAHATNGYQLIGIGAYQKGMGGAVTANPGSAMTAITNPAGMAAIGDRADFSMEAFMPERDWDFSGSGGSQKNSKVGMYGVPAIGWTAPTWDDSDFYFGGGMYGTSGMGVDYAITDFAPADLAGFGTNYRIDGYSQIQFWQMAPTLAWKMNQDLKLGAALNFDYQSVGFQERISNDSGPVMNFNLNRQANAYGYGISLGALYEINPMITLGASYKSKQNFNDLKYQLRQGDIANFPNGAGGLVSSRDGTYKMDLDYPQQLSAGIKIQPMGQLKVSADIKWINWSDTMDELEITGNFVHSTFGGAVPATGPTKAVLEPGWDDQVVYALGVDYEAIPNKLNVRAGYNYAESPIAEEDVFANLVLPAVVESHASLGATWQVNNHWDLALAYMVAFENDVTGKGDIPAPYDNFFGSDSKAKSTLSETSLSLNIGYRF